MADYEAEWNRESFGRKLKARRAELGLTQEQVREKTGMSVTALSFLETGKSTPNVETLDILSEPLGVPQTEMLEWGYAVIE